MNTHKINFEVEQSANGETVNQNGEYVFNIHTSNELDGSFERTIQAMVELWQMQHLEAYVSLNINVRVRSIYEGLIEMHRRSNDSIGFSSLPLFSALKNECQWIIKQINALEIEDDTADED